MMKLKQFINKLSRSNKVVISIIAIALVVVLAVTIPTLANLLSGSGSYTTLIWDGTQASSYSGGNGTKEDPYLISNGSELAYLASQLENNDYENNYFVLTNNILLNEGQFNYENNELEYILDGNTYYLDGHTNKYYTDTTKINIGGNVNIFPSLNNFKGNLDAQSFTIYGAYIASNSAYEIGLFTNLEGVVSNLLVTNSLVYGGTITGGIASSSSNAFFNNVLYDGYVIGTSLDNDNTIELNNITYDYAVAGGIVGFSENTIIRSSINKSKVDSQSIAGGLIGLATNDLTIERSYNNGNINSLIAGGLIGVVNNNDNVYIDQSYNTFELVLNENQGGLIGISSSNSLISISNVFNPTLNYTLGIIESSNVEVINSYCIDENTIAIGNIVGEFVLKNETVFKTKSELIALGFNEFISEDDNEINPENCWVFEENEYPILYNDNKLNSLANIFVSNYVFNRFSENVSSKYLNTNIIFKIEEANILDPIKEKYFYIANDSLNKSELDQIVDWEVVEDVNYISEQGQYIIYAKIIDYNDEISYLNSDLFILDYTSPLVDVTLNEHSWNSLNTNNLSDLELDDTGYLIVDASDELSGVAKIETFYTNELFNEVELSSLDNSFWIMGDNEILLPSKDKYIAYLKVTDNSGNSTYVNTDYIILDGYSFKYLNPGLKNTNYDGNYNISDKSSISMNITYSSSNEELINYKHNLVTNTLLPKGTKIILRDHITNKTYYYKIETDEDIYNFNSSCLDQECLKTATYPLSLFKEIGTGANEKFYPDSSYYDSGMINENFTISLDFSNTNLSDNYLNIKVYLELVDTNDVVSRETLQDTIIPFNLYTGTYSTIKFNTDYNGSIILNNDSTTSINLNSIVENYVNDEIEIIDTNLEEKKIGLLIKVVDSNGNIIDKSKLSNLKFKIEDTYYLFGKDNIIRASINDALVGINNVLSIITEEKSVLLEQGNYYIKINSFVSYDKLYPDLISNEIVIPLNVNRNDQSTNYRFNVTSENSLIINKVNEEVELIFDILCEGEIENPSVKVSLYRKDQLSGLNQDYTLIDLNTYVKNNLIEYDEFVYNTSTNFKLNFITNRLEYRSYKLIFDLYDDLNKIGTIKKYFLVK